MQITNKPSVFFKVSKYIRMSGFSKYSTVFYSNTHLHSFKNVERNWFLDNFERQTLEFGEFQFPKIAKILLFNFCEKPIFQFWSKLTIWKVISDEFQVPKIDKMFEFDIFEWQQLIFFAGRNFDFGQYWPFKGNFGPFLHV